MLTWINPVETIKEFLKEFQLEIDEYRNKTASLGAGQTLFNFVPGYQLFETDLNSLLDIYYSPLGLKSEQELSIEWKTPFHELALISYLSLLFKNEIVDRKYFISHLFRRRRVYIENPYPAMRYQLLVARHLREFGNNVIPNFLNHHEDFDMLIVTPEKMEVELECKTQSEESGNRVVISALEDMIEFLAEAKGNLNQRIQIVVECDKGIRRADSEALVENMRKILAKNDELSFKENVNGKEFRVLLKRLGEATESIPIEDAAKSLAPFMEGGYRIGYIFKTPPPLLEGFSFVAMRSLETNRPLTNLVKNFKKSERQFTGTRPSLLAIHHDSDLDLEEVLKIDNFRNAIGLAFAQHPKISGLIYSTRDNQFPSGLGYPFGRLIPFANLDAVHPIMGIDIPGLIVKEELQPIHN